MELIAALEEWRSTTMVDGGNFVTITGAMKRLHWCVGSSVVELQKNIKKLPILVKADWEAIQADALAMWPVSPSANFKNSQEDVKVFLFRVQVNIQELIIYDIILKLYEKQYRPLYIKPYGI